MVFLGPVQHLLWDRLPGPAAILQQSCSTLRGQGLRGTEQGGKVRLVHGGVCSFLWLQRWQLEVVAGKADWGCWAQCTEQKQSQGMGECGCFCAWTLSVSEPVNNRHFRAALTSKQDPSDFHNYSCPTQRADLLPKGRSCACCWHCRVYRHSYSILIRPWSGSWVCAAFMASCIIPKSILLVLMLQKQFNTKYSLIHRFRLEFLQGMVSEKHLFPPLNYEKFTQNY